MIECKQLSFWDKFKKGFFVALKSLQFVWHNKKLIFFPVLTMSLIVCTIGIYEVVYYKLYHAHITSFFPKDSRSKKKKSIDSEHVKENQSENKGSLAFLMFGFVLTFASILFFAFSNVALSYAASQAFIGVPIEIGKSLFHSIKRLPTLLIWAFFASIIRILINILKNNEENNFFALLSKLVGAAVEFAWYIATFLVIPVMAHEDGGVLKSIQRSAQLMKQTFGENLAATILFSFFYVVIIGVSTLLGLGIIFIVSMFFKIYVERADVFIFTVFFILGLTMIVASVLCCIVSAATTVFKTAVYHYAIGNLRGPFNGQEIQSSFIPEVKK